MQAPPEPGEPVEESVEPPAPSPEPEAPTPAPQPMAAAALSDDEVERIARRVLELARDMFEKIAWDVVPDMAEIVVRERVRELEEEAERGTQKPN